MIPLSRYANTLSSHQSVREAQTYNNHPERRTLKKRSEHRRSPSISELRSSEKTYKKLVCDNGNFSIHVYSLIWFAVITTNTLSIKSAFLGWLVNPQRTRRCESSRSSFCFYQNPLISALVPQERYFLSREEIPIPRRKE